MQPHHYRARLVWEGNRGDGTASYATYGRDFRISSAGKPDAPGSADPVFRGDPSRPSPEDWLLHALSGCHMLSYLALCARRGVRVVAYEDEASATMELDGAGGGRFTGATLRPVVTIADAASEPLARALHALAHEQCFIASSVSFPVAVEPTVRTSVPAAAAAARSGV